MNYFLIAGERSGDLHGANLIKAIRRHDPQATFRAWGGDMMQEAGATLDRHYRDIAFMGLGEVLRHARTILGLLGHVRRDIQAFKPDAVVMIDYGGFNMRVARFAKAQGIKTFFYISPKVWAWNQSRALNIKKYVDRMFVIFPFEVSFFKKYEYAVDYVGNPLFDSIADFQPDPTFRIAHHLVGKQVIALLPGSRKQEVETILPLMIKAVRHFPQHQFVVAGVSNLPKALYDTILVDCPLPVVIDAAYDLLSVSEAALVTSGTATLETALLNCPQVVCYRTGALTYAIGRRIIKVGFLSLVNLVAERAVVKELIQQELNEEMLVSELQKLIGDSPLRRKQLSDYAEVRQKLGDPGASERAGALMVKYARE